jgi:hypothetical protein
MKLTQAEFKEKYGVEIPKGKYRIKNKENSFDVCQYKDDTLGCILVGTYDEKTPDFIGNSVVTTTKLLNELKKYTKIDLTIDYV